MYPFLSYIKFLLTATNQHGVHSPFVYSFVTKCLYTKGNKKFTVTENALVKSISYFSVKKIGLVTDSNTLKIKLNSIFEDLDYKTVPFDLVYANEKSKAFTTIGESCIHNDTILLIEGIYKSKDNTAIWNKLKKQEQVRVTVDLYHCGVVFFRREQAKEHFKIRL